MSVVRLRDRTDATVLVSRSAAMEIRPAVEEALRKDPSSIDFDFEGIRVLAPSFIDQLLIVTKDVEANLSVGGRVKVSLRSCPPGMSEKLAAIGRAHDATVVAVDDRTWVLSRSA